MSVPPLAHAVRASGPFTNDVRRDWGISDQRKGGCMDLVLTREEGVQNPKNLEDVICERPLLCPSSLAFLVGSKCGNEERLRIRPE